MLFDSHCHLDGKQFDKDRERVIERAIENKVEYIMNPGADFKSSVDAVELAEKYDFIYAAVGIHPHDAKSLDDDILYLLEGMARKNKVKAIGEIGLDYFRNLSPKEIQKEAFRKQIRMAKKVGKPVIIHDRDANKDVFDILTEEEAFENGVLLHCFSGSKELALEYIKRDAYISLAGPLTFKNSRKSVEVVEAVPLDKLLIETDAPYLTPEPFRGKRNEPSYVEYTCEKMAQIKGISMEEMSKITLENAKRFFKIF